MYMVQTLWLAAPGWATYDSDRGGRLQQIVICWIALKVASAGLAEVYGLHMLLFIIFLSIRSCLAKLLQNLCLSFYMTRQVWNMAWSNGFNSGKLYLMMITCQFNISHARDVLTCTSYKLLGVYGIESVKLMQCQ